MSDQKTAARPYRSQLRSEQAARTRRSILEASALRFGRDGYAGTSLADIATEAGVSAETVKSHGPKRELLLASFEQAFAGAEGQGPISESEWVLQVMELPNAEFVAEVIRFVGDANRRTAGLWRAFSSAANSDPQVAETLTELLGRRRADYRAMVAAFTERGLVREDADPDELADSVSFLLSPESYEQLVLQSGWSFERYLVWLGDTLRVAAFRSDAG